MYKKLLFAVFGLSNTGRVCEHDLFAVIQSFKQRDEYFCIRDLLHSKEVTRGYNDIVDDSDETFFQAFYQDIKQIGHSIFFRKKILGIKDNTDE